ncbi:hypothetical protein [Pseudogemmobacter bohemicus]|uniref:hypothetical protein n=1 Tax=Pseudogemmobacter bohemicus TaxID=2250708 RepID=UPI000DD446DA|nr:hypothetical protein [Pseudogemmobacter bohemicus]
MAEEPEDMKKAKRLAAGPGASPVTEIAAGVMSGIWVVAVLAWVFTAPEGGESRLPGLVMTLLILFLPLALIWVAVVTLRLVADLRAEAASLKAAIDGMRGSFVAAQQEIRSVITRPEATVPPASRRETVTEVPAGPASFSSRRDQALSVPSADRKAALSPPHPEPEAEQPTLALGTPSDLARQPLSIEDFITALQFPESPEDKAGFRALRLALEDREVAKLIRAAQDVLTLLSQEGIYMDDLRPELCHPDIWRRFAAGERGRGIAAIGGIRDRSSLALAAGRLREDTIFRDAAHHFLRTFDRVFQVFEQNASDNELIHFADTRTARAFMVLGRVAGVFD